jgi:hypothetical protein
MPANANSSRSFQGPSPIARSQGNILFRSEPQDRVLKRGQNVPYDVNGSPTSPPADPTYLAISIIDLPLADPADPLFELLVMLDTITFTGNESISAGVAASAPTVFPILKNGAANGDVTITGGSGVIALSDSSYAPGDLFSIYPPAVPDATLDLVRISLEVV